MAKTPLESVLTDQEQKKRFLIFPPSQQLNLLRQDKRFRQLPIEKQARALVKLRGLEPVVEPPTQFFGALARGAREQRMAMLHPTAEGAFIESKTGEANPDALRAIKELERIVTLPVPIIGRGLELLAKPLVAERKLKQLADKWRGFAGQIPEPQSRNVWLNFAGIFARAGVVDFIGANIESASSIAALLSIPIPGAAAPARAALGQAGVLLRAGKFAKASKALEQGVKQGAKVLGQAAAAVPEVLTGIPVIRGRAPTVGAAVITPALRAVREVAGAALERIPVMARPLGRRAAPPEPIGLATRIQELAAPRGAALPPEVLAAGFRGREQAAEGVRQAAQFVKQIERRNIDIFTRADAAKLVDNATVKRLDKTRIARRIAEGDDALQLATDVIQTNNELARQLIKAGFPKDALLRLQGRYVGMFYTGKALRTANHPQLQLGVEKLLEEGRKRTRPISPRPEAAGRLRRRRITPRGPIAAREIQVRQVKTLIQENLLVGFGGLQQSIVRAPGLVSDVARQGFVRVGAEPSIIPALRGKFLRQDAARELQSFIADVSFMRNPKLIDKVIRFYKEILTVDNPLTWLGNILGNTAIADMNRLGSPLTTPAFFAETGRQFLLGSKEFEQARKAGLFAEGVVTRSREHEIVRDVIKEAAAEAGGSSLGLMFSLGAAYRKFSPIRLQQGARQLYKSQDDFYRFLAFRDGVKRGIPEAQNIVRSRAMFGDLSRTPATVRKIGSSPLLIAPFISWQYAIIPQLSRAFVENPFAAVRWRNMLNAWNSRAAAEVGEDPSVVDQYLQFRAQAQPPGVERQFTLNHPMLLLPLRDGHGHQLGIDLSSFNPYGGAITGGLIAAGPILTGAFKLMTGREIFGGRVGAEIPKEEIFADIAKTSNLPPRIIRQSLKGGLLSAAKWENGLPANDAARFLTRMFRSYEIAPSPLTGDPISPQEEFSRAFLPAIQRIDLPRQAERARRFQEAERRRLLPEEARRRERALLRELEQPMPEQGPIGP